MRRVLLVLTAAVAMGMLLVVTLTMASTGGVHLSPSGGERSAAEVRRATSVDRVRPARAQQVAALRHRRWLGSPAAIGQRVVSRMAFHGLAVGAARSLLVRDFGSELRSVSATPSVSQMVKLPVLGFVNTYKAVVRGPRGVEYVNSTLPLAHSIGGRERPVDLRLKSGTSGFGPANASGGLSIGRDLSGGAGLGSAGVRVSMIGRNVSGVSVGRSAVFYGGVGRDVDATVAPTPGGVELFATLRSHLSTEELRYRLTLPSGAVLRVVGGGVEVVRSGRVLATVAPPTATDAQGQTVPVTMTVVGNMLVLQIQHRAGSFAYPILVDPKINQEIGASGWTFEQGELGKEGVWIKTSKGPFVAREIGGIEAPKGVNYTSTTASRWVWKGPTGFAITNVVFSYSNRSTPPPEKIGDNPFSGFVGAGCGGAPAFYGSSFNGFSALGSGLKCAPTSSLYVEFSSRVSQEPALLQGNLFVDTIVVTEAARHGAEDYGSGNPSEPNIPRANCGEPVNCATGNEFDGQTDLTIGGNPGLGLTRTYNSQLAATQTSPGPFGYGWMASYGTYISLETLYCGTGTWGCTNIATIHQDNGSTVSFENGPGFELWHVRGSGVLAKLKERESGWFEYVMPNGRILVFNHQGILMTETDPNGNVTTLTHNESGQLTKAEEAAKRTITFAYNAEGLVKEATDLLGTVKYTYVGKNLTEVTDLAKHVWKFGYDGSHQMTSRTDPLTHSATTEYDSSHRVIKQEDALKHKRTWKYVVTEAGTETTVTSPTNSVTVEHFNSVNLPTSITRASGTPLAATTTYEYDSAYNLTALTDPNKHTTKYEYDVESNRTSETDALEHKTEWTYNGSNELTTITNPDGEKSTIQGVRHRPETISRPAPGETTQITTRKYDEKGDLESVTDPLEHTTKYEYDTKGDRTAEIDPEGDKRTWTYNEASQETSTVSPRGHIKAGEEAKYTTKSERDVFGRPLTVTDPIGHKTKYAYDAAGNLETQTDPIGNKTKYTYDADNERTKVEEPNKTITETGYDNAGQVTSQTDGSKHITKYVRDAREEVIETIDPRERKTTKEYDAAGNLIKITDAAKRITTNIYDAANRLKETTYSDGKTPNVKYEYNGDGKTTHITDGTGETSYTYDQLDRLTESLNGHKEKIGYEYDLANRQTKITYPNTKSTTRAYDKAGRLEKVTDWSEHTTKFAYDADSDPTTTTFPTGTSNEDKYTYNEADQMSEAKLLKGAETLASLAYLRDNNGQLKSTTSTGLPGEEKPAYEYDPNDRLKKGGTTGYEYDAADNPTKVGTGTYTYDKASELETGPSVKYTYNEVGQRTKSTPTTGSATTYGYDQAGNMTTVERPKEGEKAEIKDAYAYDANDLRTSQTISGTTTYLAWDMSQALPPLLSDGTNSYIYGPNNLPLEQINSGGTILYLHYDQAGSTRLLTSSTGAKEASFTYDAYGNTTGTTGTAKTPLGYDGQYTSSDTGLIYLRARTYDPATAQFLSTDPLVGFTRAPYNYVNDNPINETDPSGLCGTKSLGDFGDCFDPTSNGNFAHKGAVGLNNATGINLPWLLTRPAVVDAGAVLICAVPLTDAACPYTLGAAWSVSTSSVVATGIATGWCEPGKLAALETVNTALLGFGALGIYTTNAAANWGATRLARTIIRSGPVATQGILDGSLAQNGG